MSSVSSRQLGDAMERLAKRAEQLQRERAINVEQSTRAVAALDRISEILVDLEAQRTREMILAEKFAGIAGKLEGVTGLSRGGGTGEGVEKTLKKVINGAKVTGQVIEIVAGGFQGMLDSITTVVKKEQVVAESTGSETSGTAGGMDLSAILQPMSSIMQALVKSKPSGGGKAAEDKPDMPAKAEVEASPVFSGGIINDVTIASNDEFGDEPDPITAPVVKATPAGEGLSTVM